MSLSPDSNYDNVKNCHKTNVSQFNTPPCNIAIVVMASGHGSRFGSNKLLASFKERPLIHTIMSQIPRELLSNTIIITRYRELEEEVKEYGVKVLLHDYPRQRDTIRLGLEQVLWADGCMFLTCDQPLRNKDSIQNMIDIFSNNKDKIVRLGYKGTEGNPVIFPRKYYEKLMALKEGEKGQTIIKSHREDVLIVESSNQYELEDVDTMEDLERLSNTKC